MWVVSSFQATWRMCVSWVLACRSVCVAVWVCVCLTQVVSFVLGVLVDVFLGEAAEEDAVEAGVEPVQVRAAHVTDTRLGLRGARERERERGEGERGGGR